MLSSIVKRFFLILLSLFMYFLANIDKDIFKEKITHINSVNCDLIKNNGINVIYVKMLIILLLNLTVQRLNQYALKFRT